MEVANNEQWSSKGKWLLKSLQGGRYVGLLIPPNSCWLLPMGLSFLSTVEEVSRRHICKGVFAYPPSKLIITVSVWLTGDKLGNSCPRTWGAGEQLLSKTHSPHSLHSPSARQSPPSPLSAVWLLLQKACHHGNDRNRGATTLSTASGLCCHYQSN